MEDNKGEELHYRMSTDMESLRKIVDIVKVSERLHIEYLYAHTPEQLEELTKEFPDIPVFMEIILETDI
jgi:hypothetical protein